ncbi:MAG: cobalamin-binding protein [Planctomycetota bacterium]|jgi:iron complex transport system substrate-binding protein
MLGTAPRYPERIVCMTEETTEILYSIGAGDRVVGVSGFTKRPPEARSKPVISTFLEAKYDEIEALEPDLVLGFSDLQADIARDLAKRGVPVYIFNQRSVAEILQTVRVVGALVGCAPAAEELADSLAANLQRYADLPPTGLKVFLEEWHEPLISGIRWTSELVEIVGGVDICAELRSRQAAKDRIVEPAEIARRQPDVIVASWCGKRVEKDKIVGRPGWDQVPAVMNDRIHEIDSTIFLQPGPAVLTDGLEELARIVRNP